MDWVERFYNSEIDPPLQVITKQEYLEAKEEKTMKENTFKTGELFTYIGQGHSLTRGGKYEVAGYDTNSGRYKVFNDLGGWGTLPSTHMEKLSATGSFIEREGKYNLEVTGEQLAWLLILTGGSNSSAKEIKNLFYSLQKLFDSSKNNYQHKSLADMGMFIDVNTHPSFQIRQFINDLFTKPLSEEEKHLQALQDTINKAQAEIEKAQEQIKGLKKV